MGVLIKRLRDYQKGYIATGDGNSEIARLLGDAAYELEYMRDELCLRCGDYKMRHLGACNGCRWYDKPEDGT